MSKIKILAIPPDLSGCGYYRSILPHSTLQEQYGDGFSVKITFEPTQEDLTECNFIHFHKSMSFINPLEMIDNIRKVNPQAIVIMDLDDYYDLGKYHPMGNTPFNQEQKVRILELIKKADYLTTTTEIYQEVLEKFGKKVYVQDNSIDPRIPQFQNLKKPSKRIRFGIVCGSSHYHDIKNLEKLTERLHKSNLLDKMQFVLCGFDLSGTMFCFDENGNRTERPILPEETTWVAYEKILTNNYSYLPEKYAIRLKQYQQTIIDNVDGIINWNELEKDTYYVRRWTQDIDHYATHYNDIDVLLAPLKDCPFNLYKSQLKVAESGCFGVPIIAQDFGPYQLDIDSYYDVRTNKINPDGNGILISTGNNFEGWYKAIKYIIEHPESISVMGKNNKATFDEFFDIRKTVENWKNMYLELANTKN